ncbi:MULTISPECIES: hypothetical protein [Flavobacterium]|uniref:hypothetical protein n=1 Tax=Flavobacterium TaxID=237 RepID=UPI00086C1130|nr:MULTISPECIES: hypothetical protein [Flavobacterium]MBN9285726.1 hypothetical protein [Flavobacterium sp.]ODS77929.1 MAG: hypothetical protein ABS44_22130 [Chryseobacterium sp. SCN 40-13]OJV70613.1 MAG: hypothetical protein BGO42_08545 [Flavobacterium sp. 40-81]
MKKSYLSLTIIAFLGVFTLFSCQSDSDEYETITPTPTTTPVSLDLNQIPYQKLSDYHFFTGILKNNTPNARVLPYEIASGLFTDYAHKKRFVWMPEGTKAVYDGDGKVLKFPVGTALVKTFYYDNVQPSNDTRIIETRLMVKKGVDGSGNDIWIFANYIWNENQTEATLDMNGSYKPLTWKENNVTKSTNYRIPSATECLTCHKKNEKAIPIGPKPQNLNITYNYTDGAKNQLTKWMENGMLQSGYPSNIASTVNWQDTSKPLELRVRSYIDINCAHCHAENSHCDYRPMRFAFSETGNPVNLGICVSPQEYIDNSLTHIVTRGSFQRSMLHFRMNSTDEANRMPLLGRTIVHEEGVQMIEQWINSLNPNCP